MFLAADPRKIDVGDEDDYNCHQHNLSKDLELKT